MKTNSNIRFALLGGIAAFMFTAQGCGGEEHHGSDDVKSTASATEEKTEEAPAASDQGVGKFAGKDVAAFDASSADAGKKLFESKCSACHKITSDKVVGPGLKGVTERRKPQWILNMITDPATMTQKDPVAKDLLAVHLVQMTNQNVNDAEALSILNFLRQNDGAK